MKQIMTFVPAFGGNLTMQTFTSIAQMQPALAAKGYGGIVGALSFPDIAELRNMVLTHWYDQQPQCSHLLFIDADMGFPPDLVPDMLDFDKPLVGVAYPKKTLPIQWTPCALPDGESVQDGKFATVDGVGMGVCLIRRDCVTAILQKFPEIQDTRKGQIETYAHVLGNNHRLIRAFDLIDNERGRVSEDFSFCRRYRQAGGTVWASIGHRIQHVGPFSFSGCYQEHADAIASGKMKLAPEPVAI